MNEDATAEPIETVSDQPITMDEATPESSPEQAAEPEQKTDGVQQRINKLTAQKYEQQRRADALERQLAEQKAPQAPIVEPVQAPKMPDDVYDGEAMAQFQQDQASYAATVARQEAQRLFEDNQRQALEQKQQAEVQQAVSNYASNAVRDGVDIDKLRVAEQVLAQEGISPVLGQFIINDPNGGKIAEYLHDNPTVRHEILSLDPITAGHKILSEIKTQALSTTPKVSNAPEPLPEIKGGGALDKDDFERNNPGTTFI